jgi:hypothetical protein
MSGARIRNAVLSALRKELRRRVGVGGAEADGERPLVLRTGDLDASAAEEPRSAYRDRFERDDGSESQSVGELREPARDRVGGARAGDARPPARGARGALARGAGPPVRPASCEQPVARSRPMGARSIGGLLA